jgi:uncharacterized membrane protein YedE/YeeE
VKATATGSAAAVDVAASTARTPRWRYLLIGIYLGFVLVKSEAVSWFRIVEMFRFESFHMYGVIGGALAVAFISIRLMDGRVPYLREGMPAGWRRYAYGGSLFGIGWALTGACPGPIAALIGSGAWGYLVVFLAALLGAYLYGNLAERLPH